MSLKTQGKLLRVLQEQKFQRIGCGRTLDLHARVIVSTNKDIEEEIKKGNFREDLYYRLNVIPINVPPLRKRFEDIPLIIDAFLMEMEKTNRKKIKAITSKGMELLCNYLWPGNVRELKNFIERLTIMIEKDIIDEKDISSQFSKDRKEIITEDRSLFFSLEALKDAKQAFENEFIQRKLSQFGNDIKKTARAIGVKSEYLKKAYNQITKSKSK